METEKPRDANVHLTNELEELFKRYLLPDTDIYCGPLDYVEH